MSTVTKRHFGQQLAHFDGEHIAGKDLKLLTEARTNNETFCVDMLSQAVTDFFGAAINSLGTGKGEVDFVRVNGGCIR